MLCIVINNKSHYLRPRNVNALFVDISLHKGGEIDVKTLNFRRD